METSFNNHSLTITGKILRLARLRDEPYDCIEPLGDLRKELRQAKIPADIFTFMQPISQLEANYPYHLEWEQLSVLPVASYDQWWSKTLNDKTRNMIRKAGKSGVDVRVVRFDDNLIEGIRRIYNESPVRQGKPFKHYGKDFDTVKREHGTFLERSVFVGAFSGNDLIGFVKLVFGPGVASLMHIISEISQRSKAPTNALIAKSVEICLSRNVHSLHYGIWSSGGLGAFKKSHGFRLTNVPRYFVPLSAKGSLMLRLRLHRRLSEYLPPHLLECILRYRAKWYAAKVRTKPSNGAVAQLVERRGQT